MSQNGQPDDKSHHRARHKTKNKQKDINFNPNLQEKSDTDKKPAKKKFHHGSKPKQLATDVDVDAVPNPAPDTGLTHTYIYYTQTPHTGILPFLPTSTPGFSPVPPLASFATSGAVSVASAALTSAFPPIPEPTSSSTASTAQASPTHAAKHMPLVEIIIISVGGAFVFFGILAAIFVCTRPRKRTHPIPSLPILQDEYKEQKEEGDEESLFGGKERTSPRPGSNGILWNWTQYPHVSMSQKSTARTEATVGHATTTKRASTVLGEKTGYPFEGHGVTAQKDPPPVPGLQQQLHTALSKAANRVSAMSMSIYPSSPQSNTGYTDIGVALGGGYTGDNSTSLHRNDSKSARRRSAAAPEHSDNYVSGRDYGGATLTVPKAVGGGRMPVKGPYAPTASMRSSASLSRVTSDARRSLAFESMHYPLPSPPIVKSDARRERDTQALTSALGLDPPPSPQTTIHPDDSITLAGDRRRSRSLGHTRQRSSVMSPTMEASARLGNLMLAEFQSMSTLPSTCAIPQVPSTVNKGRAPPVRKRADDKPPRVPSPPPLPSLAQMALAHTNPDDYNDYRSPTYSIYGLYEADRKSQGNKY